MARHDHRFAPAPREAWAPERALTREACVRAFAETEAYTVGIEEELMLLSPTTLDLEPAVERVLAAVRDPRLRRELRASQIEIVTGVCSSVEEAGAELKGARRRLIAGTAGELLVAAAGTHPFSLVWGDVSHGARYRMLADEYGWASKRATVSGLHVHVALGDADRALAVYNALRSYLPEVGALSANSPFYEGRDTGLASVRPKLNQFFPREGVPPAFADWEEFVGFLRWAREGGAFPDATFLWWDLRPHPALGTLEVRVSDAQTAVEDTAAIAAVVQSLVAWLGERHDAGESLPAHDSLRIAENFWNALRFGLGGWVIDPETGERQPTRERVEALLGDLGPSAERLRCSGELAGARALLAGNGADRQRYVAAREGIVGLVRWLVERTDPGLDA